MDEEKRNRIIGAVTVNAVLLVIIIIAVLIYQIVTISVLSSRKKELIEQLARYEQAMEDAETELDKLQADEEYRKVKAQLAQIDPDYVYSLTDTDGDSDEND